MQTNTLTPWTFESATVYPKFGSVNLCLSSAAVRLRIVTEAAEEVCVNVTLF